MHLRFLVAATTAEALQRQKTAWEQSFAWRRRRSETKGNEMGRRRNLTLWNIRICWWEQFCFFFSFLALPKSTFYCDANDLRIPVCVFLSPPPEDPFALHFRPLSI